MDTSALVLMTQWSAETPGLCNRVVGWLVQEFPSFTVWWWTLLLSRLAVLLCQLELLLPAVATCFFFLLIYLLTSINTRCFTDLCFSIGGFCLCGLLYNHPLPFTCAAFLSLMCLLLKMLHGIWLMLGKEGKEEQEKEGQDRRIRKIRCWKRGCEWKGEWQSCCCGREQRGWRRAQAGQESHLQRICSVQPKPNPGIQRGLNVFSSLLHVGHLLARYGDMARRSFSACSVLAK